VGGIIALDPAKTIGWAAVFEPGGPVQFGHKRLGRDGAETEEVAESLAAFLDARIDLFKPDLIVRENYYIGGGRVPMNAQTIFMLCGIAWQIDLTARLCGIECRRAQTAAFTNYFIGRGKFPSRAAKKNAVRSQCAAMGWRATEDEADALALLMFAEAKMYPIESMRRTRRMRALVGPLFVPAEKIEEDLQPVV
jgi:hypothetical protein